MPTVPMQKIIESMIKWTPLLAGIGSTAVAIHNHDWVQASVSALLTSCTSLWVKFSSSFMQEAEQEAERLGGGFAKWLFVMRDKLATEVGKGLTQIWWNWTANVEGKYYQWLNYTCRNLEAQGIDIDQTVSLREIFVPLKIDRRSVSQSPSNLIQSLRNQVQLNEVREIGDLLALMKENSKYRRFAILGAPGSGKTTLLRYVNLMYANRKHRSLHPNAPQLMPVLLRLRDEYKALLNNPQLTLPELITAWVNRLQQDFQPERPLQIPSEWFAKKLKDQKCLVLLDGLDEVADDGDRQLISHWVERQMQAYPETPFIITSRRPGYERARLENVTVLAVQPFDLRQIEQFLHNWYLATQIQWQRKEDEGVKREARQQSEALIAQIKQNLTLQDLATNPLLLTLIATVHQSGSSLPQNRVGLYKEICSVLLEKRQRSKGLPSTLSAGQKQNVLQTLALDLMRRRLSEFTLEQVKGLLEKQLSRLSNPPTPEAFLLQIRNVDALIAREQEDIYEFAHLSFQEYLAAVEIKEPPGYEHLLLEVFKDQKHLAWWTETIRLYAAQSRDASNLINAALQYPTVEAIALAYDCLNEGNIREEVRIRFNQQLKEWLEASDSASFELAAKVQLTRRLRNEQLQIISDEYAISEYIACAEYQLFLDEKFKQEKFQWEYYDRLYSQNILLSERPYPSRSAPPPQCRRFALGTATDPISKISFGQARAFCIWLNDNNPIQSPLDTLTLYRLPTEAEANQYSASSNFKDLSCWTTQSSNPHSGIRIVRVKVQVSSPYKALHRYLAMGQWKEADQETFRLMASILGKGKGEVLEPDELLKFPCEELWRIDSLWVKYSHGHFGFSVQQRIYVECGAKLDGEYPGDEIWNRFFDRLGWREDEKWLEHSQLTASLSSPPGTAPMDWSARLSIGDFRGGRANIRYCGFSSLALRLSNCSTSKS